MAERPPTVVAIDGPSGVGKSTVARRLADRLGLPVLDTGATYRALALQVLDAGVDPADREAVVRLAANAAVELAPVDGGFEVRLAGRPVGGRIRRREVGEATSRISAYPEVRERLVALQRSAAARRGAVVEGRDIGTVVFPSTPHKFFLDARPEVRVRRRHAELAGRGEAPSLAAVSAELERRDARDRGREVSPLRCDGSYTVVDTSDRSIDEVVAVLLDAVAARSPA